MALTQEDIQRITQIVRDENATLRAEVNRLDEWADGLFVALRDLSSACIQGNPVLAATLAGRWKDVAQRYDLVEQGVAPFAEPESLDRLEARKMLYRQLSYERAFQPQNET